MKKLVFTFLFCISLYGCTVRSTNSKEVTEQDHFEETEFDTAVLYASDNETSYEPNKEELDPIVDAFYSNTDDKIIFYSTHKGQFFSAEGGCHEFEWSRNGSIVTITYPGLGSDKLVFDEDRHSLTLKTNSYGTIVFN